MYLFLTIFFGTWSMVLFCAWSYPMVTERWKWKIDGPIMFGLINLTALFTYLTFYFAEMT